MKYIKLSCTNEKKFKGLQKRVKPQKTESVEAGHEWLGFVVTTYPQVINKRREQLVAHIK